MTNKSGFLKKPDLLAQVTGQNLVSEIEIVSAKVLGAKLGKENTQGLVFL